MAARTTPRKRPARKGEGRPPIEVPDKVLEIIATLISGGWSDAKVARVVKVKSYRWKEIAANGRRKLKVKGGDGGSTEVSFGRILSNAESERSGGLGALILNSMKAGIRKTHPWFVKLAIHNYDTGFRDPDVVAPRIMRRQAVRDSMKDGGPVDYLAEARRPPGRSRPAARLRPPTAAPMPQAPTLKLTDRWDAAQAAPPAIGPVA